MGTSGDFLRCFGFGLWCGMDLVRVFGGLGSCVTNVEPWPFCNLASERERERGRERDFSRCLYIAGYYAVVITLKFKEFNCESWTCSQCVPPRMAPWYVLLNASLVLLSLQKHTGGNYC